MLAAQNRIAAEVARTVRECEVSGAAEVDGLKTMASWLRGHAHLSVAAAAELVRSGRALEHLPALGVAFAAGEVTADQVAAVAPIARDEHRVTAAEQDVDLSEIDAALTTIAASQPHQVLRQAVDRYLAMLDQDGPEPDPTEGRRLALSKHADGSISGRFDLDAVGGERLRAALESVVQAGRCAGDERTRHQQLADALVQLCDNQLAAGCLPTLRGHKPQVIVTVSVEDLADPATGQGAAETGSGATISAARARWLACDGQVTRIVMGPDGMPLDYGRSLRQVPPHVRRAAEVRDGGCVFAGCGAPTSWCDVHHLLEWINGGETNLENSALLCERHSHVGPPRLPGRTTSRRAMAHPATRRQRDPDRTAAHRTTPGHRRLSRRCSGQRCRVLHTSTPATSERGVHPLTMPLSPTISTRASSSAATRCNHHRSGMRTSTTCPNSDCATSGGRRRTGCTTRTAGRIEVPIAVNHSSVAPERRRAATAAMVRCEASRRPCTCASCTAAPCDTTT
ncbi:MAG TPA: DUF222 domain-containing protein [Geodermatophilus sp.]|nr:DUF222 domain-containing protein [Geodermatophilus sp.]